LIAVDTNVLVRYLVADDRQQHRIASDFLEKRLSADQPGFVSLVTVAELSWVLKSRYSVTAALIRGYISDLMATPQLTFERTEIVASGFASSHSGLADALIHFIGVAAGCERTVTFDRAFAKLEGVELLGR